MPPSTQTAEEEQRWQKLWRAPRPVFLFPEEPAEDQRNQALCPRSNSRAETKTPGQGSPFEALAIASKAARLGSVRWSCGQLDTQTPGRKQEADQKSGHWDTPQDQTLKDVLHVGCPPCTILK